MNPAGTLRARLIAIYVGVLFAGLLAFATASIYAIDRSERNGLDARLSTAAQGISVLLDLRSGHAVVDQDDKRQFLTVLGPQMSGVVVDSSGGIVLSNVSTPPFNALELPAATAGFFTLGNGETQLRAFVSPVRYHGALIGKIVIWQPIDWIEESDRSTAIAFLIAAFLIAGLAWIAGTIVARRALEDAFVRQRRFTADASHELRAPLAVIRAETDLALSRDRSPDDYRKTIATIEAEAGRMDTLLRDLLSVARAEARALERERVDANAVARDACQRLATAALAKDVTIDFQGVDRAVFSGDAAALERALLALMHNALKYSPAGGRIEVTVRHEPRSITLTVHDNGPGFSRDALEHALERFWRDETTSAHDGSGLGLSLVESIAQALDGRVELSNAGGAVARIILPSA